MYCAGAAWKSVPSGVEALVAVAFYGTAKELAEKLILLKGTGFSPYVSH
jgi:hypothetical protein